MGCLLDKLSETFGGFAALPLTVCRPISPPHKNDKYILYWVKQLLLNPNLFELKGFGIPPKDLEPAPFGRPLPHRQWRGVIFQAGRPSSYV